MKIVICGAGQVGANIAAYLCTEKNDITVIDLNPEVIRDLTQSYDIRGVIGHASHPDVLEKAGVKEADMIIAATQSDEVNMVSCQIAHSIFNVPKKIARLRSQVYRDPLWANLFSRDHLPIDVIISPEVEVAKAITERLSVPGSFNVMMFEEDQLRVIGVSCDRECPVLNTPIQHLPTLFPELDFRIACIVRKGKSFVPENTDQIFSGDEVYFVTPSEQTNRVMAVFGHNDTEARRLLIVGGGNIGFCLADMLSKEHSRVRPKIIEYDKERAQRLNEELPSVTVLNGDGLNTDLLEEANIAETETVITITNDDETNIIGGLLAKKHGASRAIALVNNPTYSQIVHNLGLDAIVSPREITVATILQHVRRGKIRAVRRLEEANVEILEIEATDRSKVINIPLKDMELPQGTTICCIFRGEDNVIIPTADNEIKAGDRVVVADVNNRIQAIEELFAPTDGYF